MKEYKKDELSVTFGKKGLLSWTLSGKVTYIGDIDFLNTYVESKKITGKEIINFLQYPNGFVMEFFWNFSTIRLGIDLDSIKYFVIEHQEQIMMQKSKSVIGRAVVGGLLLGGVGAIVGGISGSGSKNVQLSSMPDNILTICYTEAGKDNYLIFSVENKKYKDVEKFFKSCYPNLYKMPREIAEYKEIQKEMQEDNNISIADEIKKFKDLLDMGAITQEEFENQKQKLLLG